MKIGSGGKLIGDDGNPVKDAEGNEIVLKDAISEIVEERIADLKRKHERELRRKSTDDPKAAELEEERDALKEDNARLSKQLDAQTKALAKQLEEAKSSYESERNARRMEHRHNKIMAAAAQAGVDPELAILYLEKAHVSEESDGKIVDLFEFTIEADGKAETKRLDAKAAIEHFAKVKPGAVTGSNLGGSGVPATVNRHIARDKVPTTVAEKTAFIKQHGAEAYQRLVTKQE